MKTLIEYLFISSFPTLFLVTSRPNVVIVLVDDLGYGDLGYTGHPSYRSPNIDRLARDGKVLTSFYSASSVCTPSRASLLTGRHAVRSGMYPSVLMTDSVLGLPHEEITLAEVLTSYGYNSGMVGKWHLGVGVDGEYLPTHHGFSSYFGLPYSQDMCPFVSDCYPDGSCDSISPHPFTSPCPLYNQEDIVEQPVDLTSLTQRMASEAVNFINKNVENKRPFFLYFSFNHVHFPQFSSEQFRNFSVGGSYGDSVAEMDWAVGRMVETLKERGVYNNTVIVFSSDNGARLLNHGRGQGGNNGQFKCGKGTTYEGGHRVPGIISYPDKIPNGSSHAFVSNLDILPTVLGLLNIQSPLMNNVVLDGFDISSTLMYDEPSPRQEFAYIQPSAFQSFGKIHALRIDRFKAHFYTEGNIYSSNEDINCIALRKEHSPPLLYNIEHDPHERYHLTEDNFDQFREVIDMIMKEKNRIEKDLIWADSRHANHSQSAIPCCNRYCQPFPTCCSCN